MPNKTNANSQKTSNRTPKKMADNQLHKLSKFRTIFDSIYNYCQKRQGTFKKELKLKIDLPHHSLLEWFFLAVTILGALADVVLLADAFVKLDVFRTILIDFFGGSAAENFIAYFCFIFGIILASMVCILAIVFMFKSGSVRMENKNSIANFYIIIWIALGIALIMLRLFISLADAKASSDSKDVLMNEIPIIVILLILYIGTGLSAYVSGQTIGNPHIKNYHRMKRTIKRYYSGWLSGTSKKMARISIYYAKCKAIKINHDNDILQFNTLSNLMKAKYAKLLTLEIARRFRENGILVPDELFPPFGLPDAWAKESEHESTESNDTNIKIVDETDTVKKDKESEKQI
ncbi:MAG: hypothetical protein LBI63_00230 [Candidatus Ancillula sp.]|jgi:hypothetical protein|nr:hypothetical protein [Candidatus Ancillula sp.]